MSFEVTSPVSRFLTGADVLLKALNQYEKNAGSGMKVLLKKLIEKKEGTGSGMTFAALYEELTGLIFKWRKMEISFWKNALEHVASKYVYHSR